VSSGEGREARPGRASVLLARSPPSGNSLDFGPRLLLSVPPPCCGGAAAGGAAARRAAVAGVAGAATGGGGLTVVLYLMLFTERVARYSA